MDIFGNLEVYSMFYIVIVVPYASLYHIGECLYNTEEEIISFLKS